MEKRGKNGLQIRFNSELEQDLIDFFSQLKKAEVHITAISAFRMYMKSVGFYEQRRFENNARLNLSSLQQRDEFSIPKTVAENEGHFDKEGFKFLDGMFDEENDLKN
jgi:hypothetical protein